MVTVTKKPKNSEEITFEQRAIDLQEEDRKAEEEFAKARKSPFARFYQVNKDHSEDLMWLLNKNPMAYKVLLFLLDHMDKYNAVMCSYQVLQEYFGSSRQTLSNAVKLLKENGFVAILKSGTSNIYVVNNDLAWNSWGTNIKYCEFPANIILSISEQEKRINISDKHISDKRVQTVTIKEKKSK